jgi:lipid II:glycine glycyltransferase (peptidoglycan interpeptide bridge formation enzyme)
MGDKIEIRVAKKNDTLIAGILTLTHGTTVTYKYGCSDERFHHLGVMPLLLWRLIEESKAAGAETVDFGRTDFNHESLIAFKDKLGATKTQLNYYRYPRASRSHSIPWGEQAVRQFFSILPDSVSSTAGGLVYRHIG